jgi:predicted GNAT family acetyltransferase
MAGSNDNLRFSDNEGAHRFELHEGDTLVAYSEYSVLANGLLFSHTEVLPGFEGRGIGSEIAARALAEVRRRQTTAIPVCPFIAAHLRKHPEDLDLVSPASRRAFHV